MSILQLDRIETLSMDSVQLGNDINDSLQKIDRNFDRIIQSDYLRGKAGANFSVKYFRFSKNTLPNAIKNANPIIYNPIIDQNGEPRYIEMDNIYVIRNIRDAIIKNANSGYILPSDSNVTSERKLNWPTDGFLKPIKDGFGNEINWYDNLEKKSSQSCNSLIFTVEESEGKYYAYSSLAYVFTDKRFEHITDINKSEFKDITDLSCVIYFTIQNTVVDSSENLTQEGKFIAVSAFPTIKYNESNGNFYWNLYGSDSGLLAQGPKGDTASNSLIYCTYINEPKYEYTYEDENEDDTNIGELPDGVTPELGQGGGDEVVEAKANNKYIEISKVLVTYRDNETGNEITSFVDINEAIEKNYIDLSVARDTNNHIKLCAMCVPESILNTPRTSDGEDVVTNQQIIAGTVCYSNQLLESNSGKYIVRFAEQLAFNHLFNQHNFFNTMLRNWHNGDIQNTANGYGLLFTPMNSCGINGTGSTASHTIVSGFTDDGAHNELANVLNIIPVKNINSAAVRKKIADKDNPSFLLSQDIDNILMADSPMHVHYDVSLVNKSLSFKTSKVVMGDDKFDIKYNTSIPQAQFDIKYNFGINKEDYTNPSNGATGYRYNISPVLDIDYLWNNAIETKYDIDDNGNIVAGSMQEFNIIPSMGLNGLSLLLKHKDSLGQNVLDFIKSSISGDAISVEATLESHKVSYLNDSTIPSKSYINNVLGYIAVGEKSNIKSNTINYNGIVFSYTRNDKNDWLTWPKKMQYYPNIKTGSNYNEAYPADNIYLFGQVYPNKRIHQRQYNNGNLANTKGSKLVLSYGATSPYTAQGKMTTSDSGTTGIPASDFNLYRDYRTCHKLEAKGDGSSKNSTSKYSGKITINYGDIIAKEALPFEYSEQNIILKSFENIDYPHKLILTNSAKDNEPNMPSDNTAMEISSRKQYDYDQKDSLSATEQYTNYGTVISDIVIPEEMGSITDGSWKIALQFDKIIAPIINIRSHAIASPGMDFGRMTWHKKYDYRTIIYNAINTGLAINKVSHALSYRIKYKKPNGQGGWDSYYTDKRILNSTTQDIQTGVCANLDNWFIKRNADNKAIEIKQNAPMVGYTHCAELVERLAYTINRKKADGEQVQWSGAVNGWSGIPITDTSYFSRDGGDSSARLYWPIPEQCVPTDTLRNISYYSYDGSNNIAHDGYRTITLPYSLGNIGNVFNIDLSLPTITGTDDRKITNVEIIYNCEVLFDTLLDIVSGTIHEPSHYHKNWYNAETLTSQISDIIPHSKFILHDINTQGKTVYKKGSTDESVYTINVNMGNNENYYSAYRGYDYGSASYDKVHAAGYIYTTRYDLDSYYNRSFINPYALTTGNRYTLRPNDDNAIGTAYNIYSYGGSKWNSVNHLQDSSTNHPPYFIGVGIIDTDNNELNSELKNYFKGQNNKGIVYLCHEDDTAYDNIYNAKGFKDYIYKNELVSNTSGAVGSPFAQIYKSETIVESNGIKPMALWYPKSTNIFNNEYTFNEPKSVTGYNHSNYDSHEIFNFYSGSAGQLNTGFNLSNIKLAWRKCKISNNNQGYYTGHTIEFGELGNAQSAARIKMLDVKYNEGISQYTSDILGVEFISADAKKVETRNQDDTDENETTNSKLQANICNDGIVWKDDSNNYLAIHMTGEAKKYNQVRIQNPKNTEDEPVAIAGGDVLPQTNLYISRNGSRSIYKLNFTKLLLAAGRLCEKYIDDKQGDDYKMIVETTLDNA